MVIFTCSEGPVKSPSFPRVPRCFPMVWYIVGTSGSSRGRLRGDVLAEVDGDSPLLVFEHGDKLKTCAERFEVLGEKAAPEVLAERHAEHRPDHGQGVPLEREERRQALWVTRTGYCAVR